MHKNNAAHIFITLNINSSVEISFKSIQVLILIKLYANTITFFRALQGTQIIMKMT